MHALIDNMDAGIISDSLMRLLECIFFRNSYNCCMSMQNDQLGGVWGRKQFGMGEINL